MQIRRNKEKTRQLTEDEFLQFIPIRKDFEWHTNDDGLVSLTVPKFRSNFGKSFLKITRKENTFSANLDKIGTIVWKNCDGKKTVKNILETLRKEFPKEENIDQRLYLFLNQMRSLGYIEY
jgi:hypothetical protein